jgi:hypothetical protein
LIDVEDPSEEAEMLVWTPEMMVRTMRITSPEFNMKPETWVSKHNFTTFLLQEVTLFGGFTVSRQKLVVLCTSRSFLGGIHQNDSPTLGLWETCSTWPPLMGRKNGTFAHFGTLNIGPILAVYTSPFPEG